MTSLPVIILDDNLVLVEVISRQLSNLENISCDGIDCADPGLAEPRDPWQTGAQMLVVDPSQSTLTPRKLRDRLLQRFGQHETLAYLPKNAAPLAQRCLHSDFAGAVSRSRDLSTLKSAITAVLAGGLYVDDAFGHIGDAAQMHELPGTDGLSEREQEILQAVARGMRTKEIARQFNISTKTVETHKCRAMEKLGLTDQSTVIEHALSYGWQG